VEAFHLLTFLDISNNTSLGSFRVKVSEQTFSSTPKPAPCEIVHQNTKGCSDAIAGHLLSSRDPVLSISTSGFSKPVSTTSPYSSRDFALVSVLCRTREGLRDMRFTFHVRAGRPAVVSASESSLVAGAPHPALQRIHNEH
jgi:hypothetical protein